MSLDGVDFTRSQSWSNVSPRIVVDYAVNDDMMIYASYALGYKAGGFYTQQIGSLFDNQYAGGAGGLVKEDLGAASSSIALPRTWGVELKASF